MPFLRSILSVLLVLVTTLLVSCSGPTVAKVPPTYTPEKIAQIETFVAPIETARERLTELETAISNRNWADISSLIHGPIGSLRRDMRYLAETLLPNDEKEATRLAKELFGHFERIDAAARSKDAGTAIAQYQEALKDFDAFLRVVPEA